MPDLESDGVCLTGNGVDDPTEPDEKGKEKRDGPQSADKTGDRFMPVALESRHVAKCDLFQPVGRDGARGHENR